MLKSYLQSRQSPKFIIIEDSLNERGDKILDFVIKNHLNEPSTKINYFIFEGKFARTEKSQWNHQPNVEFQNYSNTLEFPVAFEEFLKNLNRYGPNDVLVFDSLAQMIFKFNEVNIYKLFNNCVFKTAVKQIVTVLHRDLMSNFDEINALFRNLSTLYMSLRPKFASENRRISYTYKKQAGKIISEIEEYKFDGDNFITNKIEKPDVQKIEQILNTNEVNPENLSTFRIGLNATEKESRDNLVLPYLPQKTEDESTTGGEIFYTLDAADDWDEEDPDDDLDF